jgi:hypothetical protein
MMQKRAWPDLHEWMLQHGYPLKRTVPMMPGSIIEMSFLPQWPQAQQSLPQQEWDGTSWRGIKANGA